MLIIRVSETLSSIRGQGTYLPYTRYSCSFTLSSYSSRPSLGPSPSALSLRASEARTNGGIVLAPFYAYPLGQIGGGRGGRSLVAVAAARWWRRRPRPPFWQLAPNNYRICFGSKRRETPQSIIILGHVTTLDIHLPKGN